MSTTETTTERIGLVVAPESIQLAPGGRAPITLIVTNLGIEVDQFTLSVEDAEPSWYTVRQPTAELMPASTGQLMLDIHPPDDLATLAGTHTLRLVVSSRKEPAKKAAIDFKLEVLAYERLEMTLRPERLNALRSGRCSVVLLNSGNVPQLVRLVISDPEDGLKSRLNEWRVSVPPGGRQEVDLSLTPRELPLVAAPRPYQFMVTASPADDDVAPPIAQVNGVLTRKAPLAFLMALPAGVRSTIPWGLTGLGAAVAGILIASAPGVRNAVDRVTGYATPIPTPAVIVPKIIVQAPTPAPQPSPAPVVAPTPKPTVPSISVPRIVSFELDPSPSGQHGQLELTWQVDGADKVTIDDAPQLASGSQLLDDVQDGEIQLVASNAAGQASQTIGVVTVRPPSIIQFQGSPEVVDPGKSVTLSWKVKGAQRAGLYGPGLDANGRQIDPAAGSLSVQPDQSGTYTLVVENELDRIEGRVAVRVQGPGAGAAQR